MCDVLSHTIEPCIAISESDESYTLCEKEEYHEYDYHRSKRLSWHFLIVFYTTHYILYMLPFPIVDLSEQACSSIHEFPHFLYTPGFIESSEELLCICYFSRKTLDMSDESLWGEYARLYLPSYTSRRYTSTNRSYCTCCS